MTCKTGREATFFRLFVIGYAILCGVLLGAGMVINVLGLQSIPELSKELPALLELQKMGHQSIVMAYVGIAIILILTFLPARKKKEPEPASLS